tara:strand:+ start:1159 stop:1818 length:660 start_codon:yes stop_codon:yes gene_type:complete
MLICYNSKLTVKTLRKICKIKGIKYVSNYNKNNLLILINSYTAASKIQKHIRFKIISDKFCPISHDILKYPMISIKVNNKFFNYDFYTFVNYLNKTGDFRDPCTRSVISDVKLNEINRLIIYYFGKKSNKILISESMIKNADLNILIYCLYDIIKEIDNKILSLTDIYNNILPRVVYYINYLIKNHSKEDCSIILSSLRETIKNEIILEYIKLMELINC